MTIELCDNNIPTYIEIRSCKQIRIFPTNLVLNVIAFMTHNKINT